MRTARTAAHTNIGSWLKHRQNARGTDTGSPFAHVNLFVNDAIRRSSKIGMKPAATAARTVSVFGDTPPQRVGAKVSNLAQEIDWRFRVASFQLAVRRAHAA